MLKIPAAKQIPIEEVALDSKGWLFLKPQLAQDEDFAFIWRDASGISWNEAARALVGAEPARWDTYILFRAILLAVRGEYGKTLVLTTKTRWIGVSPELRAHIEAFQIESWIKEHAQDKPE